MYFIKLILWVIVNIILWFGIKSLRKNRWVIYIIEVAIGILLAVFDILQNHPYGNLKMQLSWYLSNNNSSFYSIIIPIIIMTSVFVIVLNKREKI